jgi:hypothetical protein
MPLCPCHNCADVPCRLSLRGFKGGSYPLPRKLLPLPLPLLLIVLKTNDTPRMSQLR